MVNGSGAAKTAHPCRLHLSRKSKLNGISAICPCLLLRNGWTRQTRADWFQLDRTHATPYGGGVSPVSAPAIHIACGRGKATDLQPVDEGSIPSPCSHLTTLGGQDLHPFFLQTVGNTPSCACTPRQGPPCSQGRVAPSLSRNRAFSGAWQKAQMRSDLAPQVPFGPAVMMRLISCEPGQSDALPQ